MNQIKKKNTIVYMGSMNKVFCIKYTRCADLLVFYKLLTSGRNKKHHRNKDPKQLSMLLFIDTDGCQDQLYF